MFTLRRLHWPHDRSTLLAIDTSFTTGQVYRVVNSQNTFTLQETTATPPLHKTYDLTGDIEQFPTLDHVLVAELDGQTVGVSALIHDQEDRRAIVRHLYVHRTSRGLGIGHALMNAMVTQAEQWQARCLWLETQDINYPAIQFYRRAGFEWCGLDLSLDEHHGAPTDETAVFFMKALQ